MEENKQKTLFGLPVVEIDMPEIKDKIVLFSDLSNWAAIINIKPAKTCVSVDGRNIELVEGLTRLALDKHAQKL